MQKRTTRVERLSQKEERVIIKRIFFLSILSLVLALFLLTIGVGLLGSFADFLEVVFKRNGDEIENSSAPTAPRIDSLPQATNSAKLLASGFSEGGIKVEIYLDSEFIDEVEIKDGKFTFENLVLKEGENEISAKSVNRSGIKSDFSRSQTIVLDKDKPTLIVEGPTANQLFVGNNRIKVFGKTDRDSQVFANGFLANIDLEGNFEVLIPVPEGKSEIEIKAVDLAGNETVEKRGIEYKK